jgi:translocation and assembly module TamB
VSWSLPALERWWPGVVEAGALNGALSLGGPAASQVASLTWSGVRPLRSAPGLRSGATPPELAGSLTLAGDAAGVALGVATTSDGRPALTGCLHAGGAWSWPDADGFATWWQAWRERPLTGTLDLAEVELARFASVVGGVQHLAGIITGRVQVAGTIAAPQPSGDLVLSGMAVKLADLVPTLSDGAARLVLDGTRVRVASGAVHLGGEPLRLGGMVDLATPAIAVTLAGENVLLAQRHDVRLRADLDLTLSGAPAALTLAGRAVVTNAVLSPDLGLFSGGGAGLGEGRVVPFEFTTPPLSTLRFEVALSSAFAQGQDGLRLVTDLVRADCDLDLHLRGTGAAPELSGRITVRQGAVFLPFSTVRLSSGEVLFPLGDPFHPRVSAAATAQVRRWRIALTVDGPLGDPQVRAGGDGLDERDALLLLTAGATSAELSGEAGQRAALGRLGTWLGAEAWDLVAGEGDPDAGPGLLDRVTLEFGREVSDSGNDTIAAEVELTAPAEVPAVLLYGERDRWDDYNAGLILRFRWGGEE